MVSSNELGSGEHPYRLLLLAALIAAALALMVAMGMVVQSQVEKARAFYAQKVPGVETVTVSAAQTQTR
jgi:hypothetical protein